MELNITPTNARLLCEAQGLSVTPENAKKGAAIAIHKFLVEIQTNKEQEELRPPVIEPIT